MKKSASIKSRLAYDTQIVIKNVPIVNCKFGRELLGLFADQGNSWLLLIRYIKQCDLS